MYECMNVPMADRWIDGCMNVCMDGWMMDEHMNE